LTFCQRAASRKNGVELPENRIGPAFAIGKIEIETVSRKKGRFFATFERYQI
jgi:hypothetical protein